MIYDPDSYWEARGGESYKKYTESPEYAKWYVAQCKYLSYILLDRMPRCLLDFGCGTGKLFPLWAAIPNVFAYDRSESQIKIARATGFPYIIETSKSMDRTSTPYESNYFDMIVAAEVLLHILPIELPNVIKELYRIANDCLIIITAPPFINPSPHNFDHNYDGVLKPYFTISDDREIAGQRYILCAKK